jgi:DNA invertase Pin-like site-specific DNA recombinase
MMAQGDFVSYLRVSTARQGASGLGLEAQRETVAGYLTGHAGTLVEEFVETESGGKGTGERPQLRAALAACKRLGASLVVAKLDRLSRDVRMLLALVDDGVAVRFVDFPDLPEGASGRLILTMLGSVAEFERRRISERTKGALAAAKRRGVKLGTAGPANLRASTVQRQAQAAAFSDKTRATLLALRAQGLSMRAIVDELNGLNIPAPRGGKWHLATLQRQWARLQPEIHVRDVVDELRREGWHTTESIVAELERRNVFDAAGQPFGARDVAKLMMRRAA